MREEFEQRWQLARAVSGARIKQVKAESRILYALLSSTRPASVLEIGSAWGGTLHLYSGACSATASVTSVDTGKHPGAMQRVIAALTAEGRDAVWYHGGSHDASVIAKVAKRGPFEFIHVDGDHSKEGVLEDWKRYGPMVKPGGLIAFHDILFDHGSTKVCQAWPEIREGQDWAEIIGPFWNKTRHRVGIGLIWAPSD